MPPQLLLHSGSGDLVPPEVGQVGPVGWLFGGWLLPAPPWPQAHLDSRHGPASAHAFYQHCPYALQSCLCP